MPSVAAAKLQAAGDAIGSTADIPQPPQPPSHEVDSVPLLAGSSGDVVVSESPFLTPPDDDFDQERISGEDRDQEDHGDSPVETDVVVPHDELKQKIIRQASDFAYSLSLSPPSISLFWWCLIWGLLLFSCICYRLNTTLVTRICLVTNFF